MTTPAPFAAAVLAGGFSRRMGRDKAWLSGPDGRPLLHRQLDLLARLRPTQRWVAARHGQPLPELPAGVMRINDSGEHGPLGGIVNCVRAAAGVRVLVIAVDLPCLDETLLHPLLAASNGGVVAAVDGQLEPLVAVYPPSWLGTAEAALAGGELSLQRLLRGAIERQEFTRLSLSGSSRWVNWNQPEDWCGASS